MDPDEKGKPVADRLIEAAGEVFAAKGPAATVREICRAAGCSVAAVNYYFGDKQQLYLRCIESAYQQKRNLFPLPDSTVSDEPAEQLHAFVTTIARRIAAESNLSWQSALLLRESLSPTTGAMRILEKCFGEDHRVLHNLLSRLLGRELDREPLRDRFAELILSQCMYIRTGRHVRAMLKIDSPADRDVDEFAQRVFESVVIQVNQLRHSKALPPLDLPISSESDLTLNDLRN